MFQVKQQFFVTLFYNIGGGICIKSDAVREKRTTISEVIFRGKRNIKQITRKIYLCFKVKTKAENRNPFCTFLFRCPGTKPLDC